MYHALLVGQHSRPVKLIGPQLGKKFPAMFRNQRIKTILTSARNVFPPCMDGSSPEVDEAGPIHHTFQIQFRITFPSMSQLLVQWVGSPGRRYNHGQYNTSQLQVRIFANCYTANTFLFFDSLKRELLPAVNGVRNQYTSCVVEKN
jgi:hypothetical protein